MAEDEAGGPSASYRDVLDTVEKQLLSMQRRFQAGFESSPDGWAYTDLHGRFTMVNEAFCDILGRSRAELIGHLAHEFTADEDQDKRTPFGHMVASGPDSYAARKRYVRPDGTARWVDVTVHLVRDHAGQPEYFFGHVQDITEFVAAREEVEQATDRYRDLFRSFVSAVATSHEMADPFTAGHQQRVARLAVAIADALGIEDEAHEGIAVGALLHDIGKVAVPAQILTKPGPLHPAEFELVQRHAQVGHDIIAHIDFPWPVAQAVIQHHERMDGSGYPFGLTGDDILIESRIVAVADTVETISSHRPYQAARTVQEALDIVASGAGRLFDTEVVRACRGVFADGFSLVDGLLGLDFGPA